MTNTTSSGKQEDFTKIEMNKKAMGPNRVMVGEKFD